MSWERKELLRWIKKQFSSFLKSFQWSKQRKFFLEDESPTLRGFKIILLTIFAKYSPWNTPPKYSPWNRSLYCFKGEWILCHAFNEFLTFGFRIFYKILLITIFGKSWKVGSLVVSKVDKSSAMSFMNSCPLASLMYHHHLIYLDLYTKLCIFSSKSNPPYNKVSSSRDSFPFELFLRFLLNCFSHLPFSFLSFFSLIWDWPQKIHLNYTH